MGAMSRRIKGQSGQGEAPSQPTQPANEHITDLQRLAIARIERQFGNGEISRSQYREQYAFHAEQLREIARRESSRERYGRES